MSCWWRNNANACIHVPRRFNFVIQQTCFKASSKLTSSLHCKCVPQFLIALKLIAHLLGWEINVTSDCHGFFLPNRIYVYCRTKVFASNYPYLALSESIFCIEFSLMQNSMVVCQY